MSHSTRIEAPDASAIFEAYYDRIHRYVLSVIRDPAEADDLTQETFLRAYHRYDTLHDAGALSTWLYRIATHVCFDQLRQRARRAPQESEADPDDVCRALNCAVEMQIVFERLRTKRRSEGRPEPGLGIGLHTGEAVVGSIGSDRRLDYTAIGDTVNLAQRLQALAAPGQILMSANTRECVAGGLNVEALGAKQVKGKRNAVKVFALAADSPAPTFVPVLCDGEELLKVMLP